jgi:hypothetical protein
MTDDSPTVSGTEAVHALARDGHHRFAEIATEVMEDDDP